MEEAYHLFFCVIVIIIILESYRYDCDHIIVNVTQTGEHTGVRQTVIYEQVVKIVLKLTA